MIGKDENENSRLEKIKGERAIFLRAKDFPGPVGVLPDGGGEEAIRLSASILAFYVSRAKDTERLYIEYGHSGNKQEKSILTKKISKASLDKYRITR